MPVREESPPREYIAPNDLLARMRRRSARVGLLVVLVSLLLAALVISIACTWASLH
jgi:hypothetical protein